MAVVAMAMKTEEPLDDDQDVDEDVVQDDPS